MSSNSEFEYDSDIPSERVVSQPRRQNRTVNSRNRNRQPRLGENQNFMAKEDVQELLFGSMSSANAGLSLPKFTEKDEKHHGLELWLETTYEPYCLAVSAPERTKIEWLTLALQGMARLKLEKLRKEIADFSDCNYEDIKAQLLQKVSTFDSFKSSQERLRETLIDSNDMANSIWEWQKLAQIAYPNLTLNENKKILVPLFLNALPPMYFNKLKDKRQNYQDLDSAIQGTLDLYHSFNAGREQRLRYERIQNGRIKHAAAKQRSRVNKVQLQTGFDDSSESDEEASYIDLPGDHRSPSDDRFGAIEARINQLENRRFKPKYSQAPVKAKTMFGSAPPPRNLEKQSPDSAGQCTSGKRCSKHGENCTCSVAKTNADMITLSKSELQEMIASCVKAALAESNKETPRINTFGVDISNDESANDLFCDNDINDSDEITEVAHIYMMRTRVGNGSFHFMK